MKKHIVCFGDSNTHGYTSDPTDCADGGNRFNEAERWPMLLQQKLGEDYLVIEEGLNSRTSCFEDPLGEGLSAIPYISPCLRTHAPVDLLIIMLGTNDCKERFAVSASCIAQGMGRLVKKAMDTECWGVQGPNILVLCPPPMPEGVYQGIFADSMGPGSAEKSRRLAEYYKVQCDMLGCHFADAGGYGCEFNEIDYMHLTKKGHARLAEKLARLVPELA